MPRRCDETHAHPSVYPPFLVIVYVYVCVGVLYVVHHVCIEDQLDRSTLLEFGYLTSYYSTLATILCAATETALKLVTVSGWARKAQGIAMGNRPRRSHAHANESWYLKDKRV